MLDFGVAAAEIFRILHSFDYEVDAFNDEGQRVYEPEEARRFFARPVNLLVSLIDENENSAIRLYTGKNTDITDVFGLSQSLRVAATKFNLLFNMREWERDISPKTFATNASVRESKEEEMLIEGMYGTSRSSYLKLENARMIVRHTKPVNETVLGARSRNIGKIFIENGEGERTLFPVNSIAAARSMTQHVNKGGSFFDEVGSQIMRMTRDYGNLAQAARFVSSNNGSLSEGALGVRDACRARMKEMKSVFERLYRSYESEREKLDLTLMETDLTREISDLKEMMTAGEKCLDEDVLRSVAEALHGRDDTDEMDAPVNNIMVFGRAVNRDAWENLKHGKIDLIRQPNIRALEFSGPRAQISYYLGELAPVVRDDSLVNLIGHVSDEIDHSPDRDKVRKMRIFAGAVLKAAGIHLASPMAAVREFDEWVGSHTASRALNEYEPDSRESAMMDELAAAAVDRAVDEFSVVEFLDSDWGREFETTINDHQLDVEEKTIDKAYIMSALEGYLADWMARHEDLDFDPGAEEAADAVWDQVATHFSENGLIINEATELSKEDILLPPEGEDDKEDLIDEECHCDDEKDELDRFKNLAGIRK